MSRVARAVVAVVLATLVLTGWGTPAVLGPRAAAAGPAAGPSAAGAVAEPVRIMVIGDSVAHGSTGDYTWRYRLWQHLVASGVPVDLVGPHDGLYDPRTDTFAGSEHAVASFDRDHAARWGMSAVALEFPVEDLVATHRPDVVVETLGYNDLVYWRLEPSRVHEELARIVERARTADPDVDVVLGALPQTWTPGVPAFNAGLRALAARLDTAGSRVVATAVPPLDRAVDTWDTVHATATGESKLAAAVADALALVGIGPRHARPLPVVSNGPAQVARLEARAGAGSVVLSWTDPPGASGELVWTRDVTADGRWTLQGGPTGWFDTTRTVGGLAPGHVHDVRLQAFRGTAVATGRYSDVVRVRPLPPPAVQRLRVRPGERRLRVDWVRGRAATHAVLTLRRAVAGPVVRTRRVAGGSVVLRDLPPGRSLVVTVTSYAGPVAGPSVSVRATPLAP